MKYVELCSMFTVVISETGGDQKVDIFNPAAKGSLMLCIGLAR